MGFDLWAPDLDTIKPDETELEDRCVPNKRCTCSYTACTCGVPSFPGSTPPPFARTLLDLQKREISVRGTRGVCGIW